MKKLLFLGLILTLLFGCFSISYNPKSEFEKQFDDCRSLQCVTEKALENGNPLLCKNIKGTFDLKAECITIVAVSTDRLGHCETITDIGIVKEEEKEECVRRVMLNKIHESGENLTKTEKFEISESLYDEIDKCGYEEECYTTLAVQNDNPSICNEFYYSSDCIIEVAIIKQKEEYCDLIDFESGRFLCFRAFN